MTRKGPTMVYLDRGEDNPLAMLTADQLDQFGQDIARQLASMGDRAVRQHTRIKLDDMVTEAALSEALDAFAFVAQDGPYTEARLIQALRAAITAAWMHEPEG